MLHPLRQMSIDSLLVANRGEIACRVIRTARRLGIRTVAVYSDVDKYSLHVKMSDEAHLLGPAPSIKSYLNQKKILDIAKTSRCIAIHPGYGFLSENAEFAEACAKENVIFVGPSASAIRDMGVKSKAKSIMEAAGVPVVPGYHGDDQAYDHLLREAECIGFPIMIKAVSGGGGKGMRIALTQSGFKEALESAKRESLQAFGDDRVLLEKYILNPRHVEVQVFGDKYGNVLYLMERDCSVQRRHQKIIEEAPAPGINEVTRKHLGEAAVRAASAVNYVGAGTVEFVYQEESGQFYFMEMNTRLQVEHPVTEMITGTDLVEWQLRVAGGEPLPLSQDDISYKGHAFEARIYAEDPSNNFLPGAGKLFYLRTPIPDEITRVETGIVEGDEVSVYYDPMIAKLVVWGPDRSSALRRLAKKLSEYHISGLATNISFLLSLCNHPEFQVGKVDTDFIPRNHKDLFSVSEPSSEIIIQACLYILMKERFAVFGQIAKNDPLSPWESGCKSFRVSHMSHRKIYLHEPSSDTEHDVSVFDNGDGTCSMHLKGNVYPGVNGVLLNEGGKTLMISYIKGIAYHSWILPSDNQIHVISHTGIFQLHQREPRFIKAQLEGEGAGDAIAPMPGVIQEVCVKPGQEVLPGDPLVIMIAMKMEYVIKAPCHAKVEKVFFKPGDSVAKNVELVHLDRQ
ncbi:unnamed protein product [Darwinula stevensoni]|uniref:Methylcrotonoyl-CoA carboxylase subunit alpha, mitochondrial n=1 Tax=Darwinula stevensoni TaxID=69355 RepID=A0A7R8XKT0_9CRUS|nr:unnamed protein product [Darwinula stevensoni]CAG0895583.1 unnamed protein product [Darwinula stevensoni]